MACLYTPIFPVPSLQDDSMAIHSTHRASHSLVPGPLSAAVSTLYQGWGHTVWHCTAGGQQKVSYWCMGIDAFEYRVCCRLGNFVLISNMFKVLWSWQIQSIVSYIDDNWIRLDRFDDILRKEKEAMIWRDCDPNVFGQLNLFFFSIFHLYPW